jgi:hypothetical protein
MLVVAVPLAASAQQRPGGGSRPAPQAPRPAPAVRAAPPSRPAPPSGGFNFNHDVNGQPGQPRYVAPRPNAPSTGYRPPAYGSGSTGGPHQGRFAGPVIRNGHAPGGTWGWNHGVAWLPAPVYWGGGFWGPWALAGLAGAELYGSIADSQAQIIYPSYEVEPDSPGAELLQDYGLQQTPCGPPDLVVMWGPDNSVICAYPNDTVAPGNYEVDPSTFTLVSASQ